MTRFSAFALALALAGVAAALSEQRQVVCVGRSKRRPKRRLGREGAPLGQRGGCRLALNCENAGVSVEFGT